jgi:hypothetical protein
MAETVTQQIHDKFKVFAGTPDADQGIGTLGAEVTKFVAQSNVAAKSIGVEYIEASNRLLFTLGYRDDEPGYPIAVQSQVLGKVDALDAGNFTSLEEAMEKASTQQKGILCHAEYVTSGSDFVIVFLTQQT